MSIVRDFKYDVFISYAHDNNQCLAAEDLGWVTDLHDVLIKKLREEMHIEPAIWRDEGGLDGKQVHAGIAEALQSSAVFLAVVSGAYLESQYCVPKELQPFIEHPHPKFPLIVRSHKRVVTVIYDAEEELPSSEWSARQPAAATLVDAPRSVFCIMDKAVGRRKRYTKPRRTEPDPYWEAIDQLVAHLKAILGELRKGPGAGVDVVDVTERTHTAPVKLPTAWREARRQQPGGTLVYISHRAADPTKIKDELKRRKFDLVVLDHDKATSLLKRHETNLKNCDGMVVVYGADGVDWAEAVAQEARVVAREVGRPAGVGVLPNAQESEFGLESDFIILLKQSDVGMIENLDEFLSILAANQS